MIDPRDLVRHLPDDWRAATLVGRLATPEGPDLQVIKAAGVTFAVSAVERAIEERARGDATRAEAIRVGVSARVGADIRAVKPGSEAGTLFAPTQDRDEPGRGFTHKTGDVVRISSPRLGMLENEVTTSKAAAPWSFGVGDLMRNLAGRGLLGASQ